MTATLDPAGDPARPWAFHVVNDGPGAITSVRLDLAGWEWGDLGSTEEPARELGPLAPGARALAWRDDDGAAEFNVFFVVTLEGRSRRMYEFRKLYRKGRFVENRGEDLEG